MEREILSTLVKRLLKCFFLFALFSYDLVEGVGELKNITKINCSTEYDKCFAALPPLPAAGIPSTSEEIDKACNAFTVGLKCLNEFVEECMKPAQKEQFRKSFRGADETFKSLCTNEEFRKEYTKHSLCYKSVSAKWDNCAQRFIEILKSLNHTSQICCAKFSFIKCIAKIVHSKCTKEGGKFLQAMAEQTVLTEVGKKASELYCHNKEAQCADTYKHFLASNTAPRDNIILTMSTGLLVLMHSFK